MALEASTSGDGLQRAALDHLWLHFTDMGGYADQPTSRRVMEPFRRPGAMYSHGMTFGGHPVGAAVALRNIEIMGREGIIEHVRATEADFRATLEQLLELPIVGDFRGTGFLYALDLVKDKDTRTTFSEDECDRLLRGFLSPRLFERGLPCRADDRGEPVVQISPPLVARQEQFDEIVEILGGVLDEASDRMAVAT
jgi:adenosylmethionine-8-amino-7-oxononanoate aminotransferase